MLRLKGIIIFILLLVANQRADAADLPSNTRISASLLLTPARCVALHQGQVCYQHVQISWSSSAVGNYCVYQQERAAPLQCWQQQSEATLEFEYASDRSSVFQLKHAEEQVVAESTLEVAWVYKTNTRRKTHWRLF